MAPASLLIAAALTRSAIARTLHAGPIRCGSFAVPVFVTVAERSRRVAAPFSSSSENGPSRAPARKSPADAAAKAPKKKAAAAAAKIAKKTGASPRKAAPSAVKGMTTTTTKAQRAKATGKKPAAAPVGRPRKATAATSKAAGSRKVKAGAKARATAKTKATTAAAKARAARARAAAKAKAKAARARALVKARAKKAREAAKKEKAKAGIRQIKELKRSVPKVITNPVNLFRAENKMAGATFAKARESLRAKWANTPEATKQTYKKQGEASRQRFRSEVEEWLASLSPQQRSIVSSRKFQEHLRRYQARALRQVRHKRASPYAAFVKSVYPEVTAKAKRERPGLAGRGLANEAMRLAAAKWGAMSAEQKKAYAAA